MIRWRSQQSIQEQGLNRIFSSSNFYGAGYCKTLFTFKNQKVEKKVSIVPLIASWIYWGIFQHGMVTNVCAEQSELLAFAYRFDENIRRKLWLEAWEQTHAEQLREKIASKQRATNDKSVY